MIRKSTAVWKGTGPEGKGTLTSTSGTLNETPYSFATRFKSEDGKAGTNPEELVAAAHAGCFAMALSFALTNNGTPPDELRVVATVDMQKDDVGWMIKSIALDLQARVPGIDQAKLDELAAGAKKNCPISRALAATPITLSAKLA